MVPFNLTRLSLLCDMDFFKNSRNGHFNNTSEICRQPIKNSTENSKREYLNQQPTIKRNATKPLGGFYDEAAYTKLCEIINDNRESNTGTCQVPSPKRVLFLPVCSMMELRGTARPPLAPSSIGTEPPPRRLCSNFLQAVPSIEHKGSYENRMQGLQA